MLMLYHELDNFYTHRAMFQLLLNTKTPAVLTDASVNLNTLNPEDPTTLPAGNDGAGTVSTMTALGTPGETSAA